VLVAAGATLHVLDLTGAETSSLAAARPVYADRMRTKQGKGARLLGYSNWGHEVTVMDHSGKNLWSVSAFFRGGWRALGRSKWRRNR